MSNELQITVYTKPPDWEEERRQEAQNQTPQLAKPVYNFLGATADERGIGIGELRACFKSLPPSKKVGDSDILTPFACAVRSAMGSRDEPEGSKRIKLFMFLSYVAVVATRVRYCADLKLEALEDAMKTAVGTKNTTGEEKVISLDYLKGLRTGVLYLHQVINGLVEEGWLPGRATFTVISRAYLRPYRYNGLQSAHVDQIVRGMLEKTSTDDVGDGRKDAFCVAAELAKLDSKLSRDTTHKDLRYKFECATCRSMDEIRLKMNINALLDRDPDRSPDSDTATHVSTLHTGQANTVTEHRAEQNS